MLFLNAHGTFKIYCGMWNAWVFCKVVFVFICIFQKITFCIKLSFEMDFNKACVISNTFWQHCYLFY